MGPSNKPILVLALLGTYLVLASAWALFVPPYEKPDELSHFDYLRFVAREGRLPDLDEGLYAGWEAHQPPLFYFVGAGIYRLVTGLGVEQSEPAIWVDRGNPNFYWKVERNREKLGESNLYEHPESIFHPQGTFPYDLIAVRIFPVFLGMVTILFTYLTARIFFSTAEEAAILAAAVVAFLPSSLLLLPA